MPVRAKPQITVGDEQDLVSSAPPGPSRNSGRRHEDAACALDRLSDEGGDGVGAVLLDPLFQLIGQPAGKILFAFARLRVAVVMRAVDVEDAGDRNVEVPLELGMPIRLAAATVTP